MVSQFARNLEHDSQQRLGDKPESTATILPAAVRLAWTAWAGALLRGSTISRERSLRQLSALWGTRAAELDGGGGDAHVPARAARRRFVAVVGNLCAVANPAIRCAACDALEILVAVAPETSHSSAVLPMPVMASKEIQDRADGYYLSSVARDALSLLLPPQERVDPNETAPASSSSSSGTGFRFGRAKGASASSGLTSPADPPTGGDAAPWMGQRMLLEIPSTSSSSDHHPSAVVAGGSATTPLSAASGHAVISIGTAMSASDAVAIITARCCAVQGGAAPPSSSSSSAAAAAGGWTPLQADTRFSILFPPAES